MPRENIILECTECKERNYFTDKNRRKHPERVEWKKYLPAVQQAAGAQGVEVAMDQVQAARAVAGEGGLVHRGVRDFLATCGPRCTR